MKYNIITVCNEEYSSFIKLFANSLFELVDNEYINKIIVFDTGLSGETKDYLSCFPRFEIKQTEIKTNSLKIHDEGWRQNTYSKTKFLLDTLKQELIPTIMIDSDCIFLENFEDLLDYEKDFSVCSRNRKGFSKYIGSFFAALNVNKSIDFLEKWIENIDFLQQTTELKHCESPALVKTINETNFKVQEIPEVIISAVFPNKNSRIIHLKSDYYAKTVKERLSLPHAVPYVRRYL